MERREELLVRLRLLPPERRAQVLRSAGERAVRGIDCDWRNWARPGQEEPEGDWTVWVMLAGRGFGKTRAGAEWVSARAREVPGAKIALVAATPEEARRVMVEGRSGLFAAAAMRGRAGVPIEVVLRWGPARRTARMRWSMP